MYSIKKNDGVEGSLVTSCDYYYQLKKKENWIKSV